MTGGLILAAGASRRLGRTKQLLALGGRPLLAWPLAALQAAGARPLIVVLGHDAAAIQAAGFLDKAQVVINPDYAAGMSASLQCGLAALADQVDSVWILTGDQPFVTADHLHALLTQQAASGHAIVATAYSDHLGVPLLLHRDVWPLMAELKGDQGARGLLQRYPVRVTGVPALDPLLALDVDTEQQYEAVREALNGRGC